VRQVYYLQILYRDARSTEHKEYTNKRTKYIFKLHSVTVNILSLAYGHKMSNCIAFNP